MTVVMHLWFYVTPVIYNLEMIPDQARTLLSYLNPVFYLFHGFHLALVEGKMLGTSGLLVAGAWSLMLMGLAFVIHAKTRWHIAENS